MPQKGLTMTTANSNLTVLDPTDDAPIVLGDDRAPIDISPLGLALTLMSADPKGCIIAYQATFDMDAKGKMLKTGNPYLGKGLVKVSKSQATVRFDYQAKRENRGGDAPKGIRKPWHTAVLVNGKPSALSVHRQDVRCDDNGDAVYDDKGGLTYIAPEPRFYLRCELQRSGDGDKRADKALRTKSEYKLPNGDTVKYEDIKPFLPKKTRTDETDMIVVSLDNLDTLAINGQRYNVGAHVNV